MRKEERMEKMRQEKEAANERREREVRKKIIKKCKQL